MKKFDPKKCGMQFYPEFFFKKKQIPTYMKYFTCLDVTLEKAWHFDS